MFCSLKKGFDEFGRKLYFNSSSEAGFSLMPTQGLIFYDPFSAAVTTAASGQTMSSFSGVTFETVNGIEAAKFTGQRVETTELMGLGGAAPRSFSVWLKATGTSTWVNAVGVGNSASGNALFNVGSANGNAGFTGWGLDIDTGVTISDKLHHVCWTYSGTTLKCFVDGVSAYNSAQTFVNADTPLYFGGSGAGDWFYNGYIASVRIYNRELTIDEIEKLKGEFQIV